MTKTIAPILFFALGFTLISCSSKQAIDRDSQRLNDLMRAQEDSVDACYQNAKLKNPLLMAGSLKIRLDQNSSGRLSNPRPIQTFPGSEPVYQCIADQATEWRLENPETSGTVNMAWSFPLRQDPVRGLSSEDLNEVMTRYSTDFDQCHTHVKSIKPDLGEGQLKFQFTVLPSGKAANPELLSGFQGAEPLLECITRRMTYWQFPRRDIVSSATWAWSIKNN